MRKIAVLTTFNDDGYNLYAKKMLESFAEHWDKEIQMMVYYEETKPDIESDNIMYLNLNEVSPDIVAFKTKYKNDPIANGELGTSDNGLIRPDTVSLKHKFTPSFLFDAVRFSHKVYSILHAARTSDADLLIWVDADIFTHSPVTVDFLLNYTPEEVYTCCLKRDGRYSECGFVSYNLKHSGHEEFMKRWGDLYNTGTLFDMTEWHDSFVYDQVRLKMEQENLITSHSYSGEYSKTGHPFINCELGNYMDHLKGVRKTKGHSDKIDLKRIRTEQHWKSIT